MSDVERAKQADKARKDATDRGVARVSRMDLGEAIRTVESTPSGGRRLSGNFSRVGVFNYRQADGSLQREFRPPEEVFHPDSVASFVGAPITILHPPDMVDPSNWKEYSIGHVLNSSAEPPYVSGHTDVNHFDGIDKIDSGELKEISTGYTADIDPTPGIWEGQPYDVVQRNILVNHVAFGPNGWGRQGPSVSLRTDSGFAISVDMGTEQLTNKRVVVLDGVAFDQGSDTHVQAMQKKIDSLAGSISDLTTAKTAAETRAADAEKRSDAKTIAKRAGVRANLIIRARHAMAYRARLDGDRKAYDAAFRYLDADDEEAAKSTDGDIVKKTLLAMCPGYPVDDLSDDQLVGALHAMAHKIGPDGNGAAADPDEEPDPEADAEGGYGVDDSQQNGVFPDKDMPGVPSKDTGMVPQPAGSVPSKENEAPADKQGPSGAAMRPPPRPFDKKDHWDQRFVPRGAFARTDSRDARGVPREQGQQGNTEPETEAQARQRVIKRDAKRWQDPEGKYGISRKG